MVKEQNINDGVSSLNSLINHRYRWLCRSTWQNLLKSREDSENMFEDFPFSVSASAGVRWHVWFGGRFVILKDCTQEATSYEDLARALEADRPGIECQFPLSFSAPSWARYIIIINISFLTCGLQAVVRTPRCLGSFGEKICGVPWHTVGAY